MLVNNKSERLKEIKKLIQSFCEVRLNNDIEEFPMNLCDDLSRAEGINLSRGKIEIWAASIIYVIARLNFLFDKANGVYITSDIICDFFNTKKSTVANKATWVEKNYDLNHGIERYCSQDIIDAFTFYETPEGFVIPKSMAGEFEIIYEFADEEESEAIGKFIENKKIDEQKALAKKKQQTQTNRKIAVDKELENDPQLDLFSDFQHNK